MILIWLLILIRLLISSPFGRPSEGVHPGIRRAAPFDEVEHIEEVQRSKSEVPYAGAKPFAYFSASG
ncbi:hypothetical protein, partial [Pseudomonas sp. AIG]